MVREAIFTDPEVIKLLSTRFVPLALRTGWRDLLAPEESKFLSSLKAASTGGCLVCTAGGKQLPLSVRPFGKEGIKEIKALLANFQPEEDLVIPPLSAKSLSSVPTIPDGCQVLYVTWNVLAGLPKVPSNQTQLQTALGIDRFVITKEEVAALERGQLNESLKLRMFTKPMPFSAGEPKKLDLVLREGRLSGAVSCETKKKNDSGYEFGFGGDCFGFVETKAGKLSRFDVVVKGTWRYLLGKNQPNFSDYGSNLSWIPSGQKATVAITFSLADSTEPLSRVLPHSIVQPLDWGWYFR